jgi:hypothetical protein
MRISDARPGTAGYHTPSDLYSVIANSRNATKPALRRSTARRRSAAAIISPARCDLYETGGARFAGAIRLEAGTVEFFLQQRRWQTVANGDTRRQSAKSGRYF